MPEPIHIPAPEITRDDDSLTVAFELDLANGPCDFIYRITDPDVQPTNLGEALVSCAFMLAMHEERDIQCDLPLSAEFLSNNEHLQKIFTRWWPELHKISIHAPGRTLPDRKPTPPWLPAKHGAAVMFSGGVDSFHTALEFQDDISTAIYIHGFDTELEDETYREKISAHLQAACTDLGFRLIEVECNARQHTDDTIYWGNYHHAMIASTAQLLSESFERLYIPSSYTYSQLTAWGSHPLTDPLWASGDLHIIHHGSAFNRPEKVTAIADSQIARNHLRVCWQNIDEAYNCGTCEKCLRTMINLKVYGKLEAFQHLFATELNVAELIPFLYEGEPKKLIFLNNNIEEAKRLNSDPALLAELEAAATAATHFYATKAIAKHSAKTEGDYFATPAWRDHLLPKVRNQLFDEQLTTDPEWLANQLISEHGRDKIFDLLWQHDRNWLKQQAAKKK